MAHDRIVQDPEIMGGKPVIKGTRMPVYILVRECAHGSPSMSRGSTTMSRQTTFGPRWPMPPNS